MCLRTSISGKLTVLKLVKSFFITATKIRLFFNASFSRVVMRKNASIVKQKRRPHFVVHVRFKEMCTQIEYASRRYGYNCCFCVQCETNRTPHFSFSFLLFLLFLFSKFSSLFSLGEGLCLRLRPLLRHLFVFPKNANLIIEITKI